MWVQGNHTAEQQRYSKHHGNELLRDFIRIPNHGGIGRTTQQQSEDDSNSCHGGVLLRKWFLATTASTMLPKHKAVCNREVNLPTVRPRGGSRRTTCCDSARSFFTLLIFNQPSFLHFQNGQPTSGFDLVSDVLWCQIVRHRTISGRHSRWNEMAALPGPPSPQFRLNIDSQL